MLQTALREDALTTSPEGFELRIGLPWIRSMPLSSVSGLAVWIDGALLTADELVVMLGERGSIPADSLETERGWWFVQDRLVVAGRRRLSAGTRSVSVRFELLVPYLQSRPGSPLILPFRLDARLEPDRAAVPAFSRDVA